MKFKFIVTKTFERNLKKLNNIEQKQVALKLKVLQLNRRHPSLRTKKIGGYENLFELSVNMDIRIFWRYKGSEIIVLLDVGHHHILNKL